MDQIAYREIGNPDLTFNGRVDFRVAEIDLRLFQQCLCFDDVRLQPLACSQELIDSRLGNVLVLDQ